ncbi:MULTISPECIES: DUF6177 family protein [Thermomonosporaceae]|uniref:DUF6177 family protein n=1 Tax=Thermomonosporaceae TaxID=2012 RepID=UPI00255B1F5D|nr:MULTISPECIES: DUF6177 family protein [Thermomonosporaceae]MDL4772593.1 DUF6177 family protein [Actinomadura xylanilytica]
MTERTGQPTAGGADALTERAMVVLLERPVVALNADLAEMLAECERSGRVLQIVTPPGSRLTLPLHRVVTGTEARWVVCDGDAYYEGATGRPLYWDGSSFALVPDALDYAPGFIARPTAPTGAQVALTFQVRHPSDGTLGGQVERLMVMLTGRPPIGWGATEPLEHRWEPAALTASARDAVRRGGIAKLIAIGAGPRTAIATLEFSAFAPPATGIAEMSVLTVGYAPDDPPPVADLPALVDRLAAEHHLGALLAQLTPGSADLTTEPRWTGSPAPIGLAAAGALTGPPGFTRQRIGPEHAPMTWFGLGDGRSPEYWRRHQELLRHLRSTS